MVDGEESITELGYGSVFMQLDEWDDAGCHAHGVGTNLCFKEEMEPIMGFLDLIPKC